MALPIDFITRTRALLGNEFDSFEAALQADVPVSIRINEKKGAPIPAADTPDNRVAWCDTGYYLPERLSFTFDPLFHAGAYYVQEASSMFLEQVIRSHVKTPVRCLDLCAAPGGKSTHLAACLPEGSLLVSNEVIRSRSHILAENIAKWGNPNCVVTNNDPKEIGRLTHFFDVIVADVPCSGEGMFRKDTDSTGEWSIANVALCAGRGRRIIHDIWNALKPGGRAGHRQRQHSGRRQRIPAVWPQLRRRFHTHTPPNRPAGTGPRCPQSPAAGRPLSPRSGQSHRRRCARAPAPGPPP